MESNILKVTDFTRFPASRFRRLGPGSGEEFRESYLTPSLEKFGKDLRISLDGAMGYGSSFLEESFGGLIRAGADPDILLHIAKNNLICEDDPSLEDEVLDYILEAITVAKHERS